MLAMSKRASSPSSKRGPQALRFENAREIRAMTPKKPTRQLELAKRGEGLAATFLERAGYEIVARNARTRWGEIDLVAKDGGTWVFVEVKTRTSNRYGSGAEAVTRLKQLKILRMAEILLSRLALSDVAVRFDVVEVNLAPSRPPEIRHVPGAFGE